MRAVTVTLVCGVLAAVAAQRIMVRMCVHAFVLACLTKCVSLPSKCYDLGRFFD